MLNIQINDPVLEQNIKAAYGSNTQSIIDAFSHFIQHQKIIKDVSISKEQAINAEVIELDDVINHICEKYE